MEALRDAVLSSSLLVTILDPFTFESEWVEKENEWARDAEIPIIALYDGDRYRWEDVAKWRHKYPHVFKYQALEYAKNFRTESRNKLLAAVNGRLSGSVGLVPAHSVHSAHSGKSVHGSSDSASTTTAATERKTSKDSVTSEGSLAARRQSSKLAVSTACPVDIAVGSAVNADPARAAQMAAKQLKRKLGGKDPNFLIVAAGFDFMSLVTMGKQDKIDLCKKVSAGVEEELPGIQFAGCLSAAGLMIDSDWKEQEGCVTVGIWGIVDTKGKYVVVHQSVDAGICTPDTFGGMGAPYPGVDIETAGYDGMRAVEEERRGESDGGSQDGSDG
jgi:hypothetical protein